MSEPDSIADALERFFAQEAEAITRPEFLPFVQLPEFRDCLAFRVAQEVGRIVADGLALRFAPAIGWRDKARRTFLGAYVDALDGTMQSLPMLLEAPTVGRADVRTAIVSGFEERLSTLAAQASGGA